MKRPLDYQGVWEKKNIFVTFLNPYTLSVMREYSRIFDSLDYICSDGIVPIILERLFGYQTTRMSFDFGSLAKDVFEYAEKNQKSVYFVGTTKEYLQLAIAKIKKLYPELIIVGMQDGYFSDEQKVVSEILICKPDIVILGLGVPKQDLLAVQLKQTGFHGACYTCGGFLHQTALSDNGYYYPEWINKWNLRTFYRLIHEPYVIKRLLFYYVPFIFSYSFFLACQRIKDFRKRRRVAAERSNLNF